MMRQWRWAVLLLAVMMGLTAVSCGSRMPDDAEVIASHLQYFDEPERVRILRLQKFEFSDQVIYYMERGPYDEGETGSTELLLVCRSGSPEVEFAFFRDMEYGLHSDVKALWDARAEKAVSSRVYTTGEIGKLIDDAVKIIGKGK